MSSSSDDDDSSDDELFTSANDGEDREAIVTKRLLQNFYGKSVVDDDDPGTPGKIRNKQRRKVEGNVHDLDSPAFDANLHALNQIRSSTTHDLLETEERLALSVRNLDSTMQTLVYENYSKFIDATDAIHAIGVNVQANEAGLRQLTESMGKVAARTRTVDEALGSLRDQVADKIRVQRLLTRLDALLKLPKTLELYIQQGHYLQATKAYLNAASILAKHSEGFESLKSIETQCKSIMEIFDAELNKKILCWSGKAMEELDHTSIDPVSISEVFECTGALNVLAQEETGRFPPEDLLSMAVTAAIRYLDRLLDIHLVQVQERRFGSSFDAGIMSPSSVDLNNTVGGLIPTDFLVSLLEGVKLFYEAFSFGNTEEHCQFYVIELISEAFEAFLSHQRVVFLEENSRTDADEEGDAVQKEVSLSLTSLVQHVQQFEAGLIVVGIDGEFATKLVDKTLELTESMVRRRVDQKFQDLRQTVVKDCLVPFAENATEEREKDEPAAVTRVAQIASSMLSDCMQLVDDSIRSIYVDATPDDMADLKDAVHSSTLEFAMWLANAFEILAGEEPAARIVEAPIEDEDFDSDDDEPRDSSSPFNEHSYIVGQEEMKLIELLDTARDQLLDDDGFIVSEVTLAIVELCRQASESVPQSIQQSFKSHLGESSKKKSVELFPGEGGIDAIDNEEQHEACRRFKSGVSLLFMQYVVNQAEMAALTVMQYMPDLASRGENEVSNGPSQPILDCLSMAKQLHSDISEIFEVGKRGTVIPKWKDDDSGQVTTLSGSRKTGVYLDVERMFKEHVVVYPHPSELIKLTAAAGLFLFLKIVMSSLVEYAKQHSFTSAGYKQAEIDYLFLKQLVCHYVDEKEIIGGMNCCSALRNLLKDFIDSARDRYSDNGSIGQAEISTEACDIVKVYLSDGTAISDSGLSHAFETILLKDNDSA